MIDKVTQKLAALERLRQRPPAQDTDELAALERGYRELAADLKVRMVGLEAERRRLRGATTDIPPRWGGEEFAIVLPETDAEGAVCAAERVRAALARHDIHGPEGALLHVTASFGVASGNAGTTSEELVALAHEALYRAKRAGKDRVDAGLSPVSSL